VLAIPQTTHAFPLSHNAEIYLDFSYIQQGEIGVVQVRGTNIKHVYGELRGARIPFYQLKLPADIHRHYQEWTGFVALPMSAPVGLAELTLAIEYGNGDYEVQTRPIEILTGGYITEVVDLPPEVNALLSQPPSEIGPEVNQNEAELLYEQTRHFTQTCWWQKSGLTLPLNSFVASGYGVGRVYPALGETNYHTGADFPAALNTPVPASANGRVVVAELLLNRGYYVLVNHGCGLYSGYAHLVAIYVRVGDTIEQGDILGRVGSTGRSTAPHLHFELALNGIWVNPLEVIPLFNELKVD
jgi:hypothetical protein